MTHDEIERLKLIITRAHANEQLEFAEILIKELNANNECFDNNEYDIDKSYEIQDELTFLIDKIRKKIEIRKIKLLKARYDNLPKQKQKLFLKEIETLLSDIEITSIKKTNSKCRQEGHLYNEWEEIIYITEKLIKDEDNNRKFIKCEIPYWTKKCKRCGYEHKVKTEPEEITLKRIKNKSN